MPHITNQQLQWFHSNVSCSPLFPLLPTLTLPICVSLSHPSHFFHFTHSYSFHYSRCLVIQRCAHPFVLVPLLFLFCSFGSVCIFSLSLQWATIECICYATVKIRLTCADDYRLRGYFFFRSFSLPPLQFDCYKYRFWIFFYPVFSAAAAECVCVSGTVWTCMFHSFFFLLFRICIGQNRKRFIRRLSPCMVFWCFSLCVVVITVAVFFAILFFFSFTVYFVPAVCLYLRHTVQ